MRASRRFARAAPLGGREPRDQRERGDSGRDTDDVPDQAAAERERRRRQHRGAEPDRAGCQRGQRRDAANDDRSVFRLLASELDGPVGKLGDDEQRASDERRDWIEGGRVLRNHRRRIPREKDDEAGSDKAGAAKRYREEHEDDARGTEQPERWLHERGVYREAGRSGHRGKTGR
jgi:hypothetical protein